MRKSKLVAYFAKVSLGVRVARRVKVQLRVKEREREGKKKYRYQTRDKEGE